ncbi:MAG: CehA/McbA family metallohydrolase [Deltaproteobacteria bacterium]|nr:CehA/McbA family metallohydrolase [Deltaproteobacteria bacterium]
MATLLGACGVPTPNAGILTEENVDAIVPKGETAGGRVGDYFLKNAAATFIIQRPGRELALGPYGGTVIDAALTGAEDRFGELIPTLALGRTVAVHSMRVVADGSDGGSAIVEAVGTDAVNVYYNLEAIAPSLLAYAKDGSGILGHDPEETLSLAVRIRYELLPDEPRLDVTYTFENLSPTRLEVPLSFIVDTRANVESYLPGTGFAATLSRSMDPENIAGVLTYDETTSQYLVVAEDSALSIVPTELAGVRPPRTIAAQFPVVGGFLLVGSRNLAGAAKEASFTLDRDEAALMRLSIILRAAPEAALAAGWELLQTPLESVGGCVTFPSGAPAVGARVGLMQDETRPMAVAITDAGGCVTARVPPGSYTAIAGGAHRESGAAVAVDADRSFALTLPAPGRLRLEVSVHDTLDALTPELRPCRLTLVGERRATAHPALATTPDDDPGGIVARQHLLATCEGELELPAGRYLAIVTRGPEFDRVEATIEVVAGAVRTVQGALHRVVDSDGYAASDFHVHSIYSPDSRVPAALRVLSLAAEGLDFWASTDHDVVVDFTTPIAALGLTAQIQTIPGAEVTTFDAGHFGAYPLPVDPSRANGGTPDWAPSDDGRRPTMSELFTAIHRLGGLIQVNHPRSRGLAMGAYFSRAGVRYDPTSRRPYADAAAQPVANELLRYPAGLSYFSDAFDIVEVMNGAHTYVDGDMVHDTGAERAGHDWMSLLSAGRKVIAVANSDTHTLASIPGNPRTFVGGHHQGRYGLLTALARGDAVLTTGPMLRVTLEDASGARAGLGDTLTPTTRTVTLKVHVETPAWYDVDRLEVVANAFFVNPDQDEPTPRALPLETLTPVAVPRPNGGVAHVSDAAVVLDLDLPPFAGRDSWVVVRTGGVASTVWPVMAGGGGTVDLAATTPEAFVQDRYGARPFAMTNAIYIDTDGDGAWRP